MSTKRKIIAKEVYGYALLCVFGLALFGVGLAFIIIEQKKHVEQRSAGKIITGICVSASGSFIILVTIIFLLLKY